MVDNNRNLIVLNFYRLYNGNSPNHWFHKYPTQSSDQDGNWIDVMHRFSQQLADSRYAFYLTIDFHSQVESK